MASFRAVLRMDLGFQPEQVVTATVTLPATSYQDGSSLVAFERRALEAIRARPDVLSAGIVSTVPFSGALTNSVIAAEGYEMKRGESLVAPNQSIASPGYFESMRIPIVSGRGFDDRDGAASAGVVIVDERLARRFWPERDPIGRRMYFPEDPSQASKTTAGTEFLTVVGIVREVQAVDPRAEFAPVGTYYLSYEQVTARTFTFTVRTRHPATTILPAIRQHVAAIDPQIPLFRPRPMQEWIDRALAARRVPMLIASAFGLLALLLSGVGIYGVLACSVSQRQRELGVRMALGSTTSGIFGLVLRDGAKIIASGLSVGLGGATFIGRLMKAQLYGVRSADPAIIAGVAAALTMIALVAIVILPWRAARINPTVALNG
jgi:predicted permease